MTLPEPGDLNWGSPLNDAILAAQADAASAKADASSARSTAIAAHSTAQSVKEFVEAPTDEQIAAKVAEVASASQGAVDARVDAKVDPIRDLSDETFAANLSASYATTGEVRSKVKVGNTDAVNTAIMQAELDALYDAGGGTLVVPACPLGAVPIKVTNLTLKNDGATPAKMPTIVLRGQGMHWSGRGTVPQGGTIIEFTGTDTYGLIKTNALGALVLTGITFRNTTTANSTPFIYTTNTTLLISKCAFYGAKTGDNCDQDAIILGGPNQVEGASGWTDGFQGYGTVIAENFFSGIRRAVYGRAFANAVVVRDNTVWNTCGYPTGAAIEWDGKPTGVGVQTSGGCLFSGNLLEVLHYKYGFWLKNTQKNTLIGNGTYDPGPSITSAAVRCESTAVNNTVIPSFADGYLPAMSEATPSTNILIAGAHTSKLNGELLAQKFSVHSSSAVTSYLQWQRTRTITDGVLNGTTTLTSATAAFSASSDVGKVVTGTGIPDRTTIASVTNATTVVLSTAATATATGVSVTIERADQWAMYLLSGSQNLFIRDLVNNRTQVTYVGGADDSAATVTYGARLAALGSHHDFGPTTNRVRVGSLGTTDGWVDANGGSSNADVNLKLRAKGAGEVQPQSHMRMASGKFFYLPRGNTASRPAGIGATDVVQYFDTTLGKPIWWSGSAWVDATGATV